MGEKTIQMGPDTKSEATIYFTVQSSATVRARQVLKMVYLGVLIIIWLGDFFHAL